MKKRDSRRRWKARIRLGQKVPWMFVVDHRLENFVPYERSFDTDLAYWLRERPARTAPITYEVVP
jgi:hypothetical protein